MAAQELTPDRSGALEEGAFRIHWERFGDGSREAVALLNGLAMHTQAWYPFLPQLLADYDVVLYDYPGQGESSRDDVPVTIPQLAGWLDRVRSELAIAKLHVMGISYGGFVAMDYARLFPDRLHTLTLSGILLSHEELFSMYQDLSLLFYRSGPQAFEIYTHYMYEKIFGEAFVRKVKDRLPEMRRRFHERYKDQVHALIRLTLAQDPFFDELETNLAGYRAFDGPTLILAGAEDRAIPPWVQGKLCDVFPRRRFELVEDSGHVVYLERPDVFWPTLKSFLAAKDVTF
jgi:3-oxoadipate enol-lactonase